MVTYKKLLEMLDSVEKTEDGKKFKSKIKKLKKQTTELIEDQDTEGKGPAGKRVKEMKDGGMVVKDKIVAMDTSPNSGLITVKGFGAGRRT